MQLFFENLLTGWRSVHIIAHIELLKHASTQQFDREGNRMIELTKLSRQHFVLNEDQIQFIEFIPETKITMMNGTGG